MVLGFLSVFLLAVNVATFLVFAHDKARAVNGGWRVREADLLFLALVGGSVGAVAAQQILRHKTRKEPFRTLLQVTIVVQAGAIIGFLLL